jgi:cell division septation protein DedD
MSEPLRARPNGPLAITKGHLYALGALSFAMSTLTFFIGLQVGRGATAPVAAPAVAALLDEEARTGNLEALLMRVEASHAEGKLIFPTELPKSAPPMAPLPEVGPDGAPVEPAADAAAVPPAPPPVLVPQAPPEGSASVSAAPEAPAASDQVPSGGWAIQIGKRESEAEAERLVQTLRAAGLSAYHVEALVDGKPEHRVRVGGYASEAAANAALSEVQGRAGAPSASVTKAI